MTRRFLLSMPFVGALARAAGVKPKSAAEVLWANSHPMREDRLFAWLFVTKTGRKFQLMSDGSTQEVARNRGRG